MMVVFVKNRLALRHGTGLVVLFAVYTFIAAGLQAARAFSSARAGPVIGHLLLALVDLAAGWSHWPGRPARR